MPNDILYAIPFDDRHPQVLILAHEFSKGFFFGGAGMVINSPLISTISAEILFDPILIRSR